MVLSLKRLPSYHHSLRDRFLATMFFTGCLRGWVQTVPWYEIMRSCGKYICRVYDQIVTKHEISPMVNFS